MHAPAPALRSRKKAANLSIDSALLEQAKRLGLNLSNYWQCRSYLCQT